MRRILTLTLANAAGALHFFVLAYVSSSYLERFLSPAHLGYVYSAAALLTILGFAVAPRILARYSVRQVAVTLSLLDAATLLALASGPSAVLAIGLIVMQGALAPLIGYMIDLLLENVTRDGQTGRVRGLFLTAGNVALVSSPLIIGLVLGQTEHYERVFLLSAAAIGIFFLLIMMRHRVADVRLFRIASLGDTLACLVHAPETRSLLIANTLLQNFFVWAPIYIPLYLHGELGIPWGDLGPLFALMLLPFLLIELPMGLFEDRFRGERVVMAGGFFIAGISLVSLSFAASFGLAAIGAALVATRVGAALIEITAETSFFRGVGRADPNSVNFFRMTRPLGMLFGPLIASVLLAGFSLQYLFVPLGVLMLLGVPFALRIRND